MTNIEEREKSPMRSLERALHLLAVLQEAGSSQGLTELGKASRLSKPTALRMLSILEKYGFVEKRHGRYRLGVATLPLAHAYIVGNELTRVSLPVLQELAQRTGETTSLFIRQRFKRILVQRVEGVNPLRFVLPLGDKLPIHVGAGKVLAAAMTRDEIRQMLEELGEIRLANGQPMSREAVMAELRRVRKQGYAVSLGERMLGIIAVAAPVVDAKGMTIAAVSVAGTADRLPSKKVEWLSLEVRDAAKMIAERYDGGSWGKGTV